MYAEVGDRIEISLAVAPGEVVQWERLKTSQVNYDIRPRDSLSMAYLPKPFAKGAVVHWQAEAGTYLLRYKISRRGKFIETNQPLTGHCGQEMPCHGELSHALKIQVKTPGDRPIDYATELIGVPFVMGPRNISGIGHQTDLGVGTDCAALVTYGLRRAGFSIPYAGPKGIGRYLKGGKQLLNVTEGIAVKPGSLQEGDILHFGHQVSYFYKDLGKNGELDGKDLLLHSYHDEANTITFEKTAYFRDYFRVYSAPKSN